MNIGFLRRLAVTSSRDEIRQKEPSTLRPCLHTERGTRGRAPEDRLKFSELLKAEGRLTLPVEESGGEWTVPISNQQAMERAFARGVVARKEMEKEEVGSRPGEQVAGLVAYKRQTRSLKRLASSGAFS